MSSRMHAADTSTVTRGRWTGTARGGAVVFHGIRYATAERFGPPVVEPRPKGPVDATAPGPAAPQLPSRLASVMGSAEEAGQSERECLRLTVSRPATDDPALLPVLVWFHGGAFVSGSSQWNLYAADRLAAEGRLVVVSVSYRLGVLGYLRAEGVAAGNAGLLDQIAALRWIRGTVAEFGGDPSNVTVAGQSAGAKSALALLGVEETEGMFRRVVLQSLRRGTYLHSPEEAAAVARDLGRELGDDARHVPVADILAAQGRIMRRSAGRFGLTTMSPFGPVTSTAPLPDEEAFVARIRRRAEGLDVLIGATSDEYRAFWAHNPTLQRLRRFPVVGSRLADRWEATATARDFTGPSARLASELAAAGATVYHYRLRGFDQGAPYGAPHCLEVPLLFGDDSARHASPMLQGVPPDTVDRAGREIRAIWSGFAATGRPSVPGWRPLGPEPADMQEFSWR